MTLVSSLRQTGVTTQATERPENEVEETSSFQDLGFADGYELDFDGLVSDGSELQNDGSLGSIRPAGRGRLLAHNGQLGSSEGQGSFKRPKIDADFAHSLKGSVQPLGVPDLAKSRRCSLFDAQLQDACFRIQRDNPVKLPWETGFGQAVFGRPSIGPSFQLPMIGRYEGFSAPATVDAGTSFEQWSTQLPFQSRRLLAARLVKSDDHLRAAALKRIRAIVLFCPADSQLGLSLMNKAGTLVGEDEIARSFSDCFCGKSTGTLVKRSYDFHRFAVWQVETNHANPLQPTESDLYQYLNHLRDTGRAATSGDAFLKSWAFMQHVVGAGRLGSGSLISGRVSGAAKAMYLCKRPLKQAPPLTSDMVWALENLLFGSVVDSKLKAILGFALFCLYSSSRFGDASRSHGITVDTAGHMYLLETATSFYKTATTVEKRTTMLPLIAIGTALHDLPWCMEWVRARKAEGLDGHQFLMPALSEITDQWLDRPMSTGEGAYWLRDFMVLAGISKDEAVKFSCHSLKCTAISWVTKAGVMTAHERKIMGHHWDNENAMPLTYSRDALADIMVKLYRVVYAIRMGQFNPDATRAERVAAATAGQVILPADAPECEFEEDPVDGPGQDSDVSSEDLEPDERTLESKMPSSSHMRLPFPAVNLKDCRQHRISGIVHLMLSDETLYCGRRLTANMVEAKFDEKQVHEQTFCEQCHKAILG